MNSSNIFNIRKKSTLITLVSFLPKIMKLELIRENKRLQKALNIKEVLYQIYNIKNQNITIQNMIWLPMEKMNILKEKY